MRGVGEFPQLACDQIGGLLADVDRVVADSLEAAEHEQHPKAPFAESLVAAEL